MMQIGYCIERIRATSLLVQSVGRPSTKRMLDSSSDGRSTIGREMGRSTSGMLALFPSEEPPRTKTGSSKGLAPRGIDPAGSGIRLPKAVRLTPAGPSKP
jgi:hypothetical protein